MAKAERQTIWADWELADGEHQPGWVGTYTPGMREPALLVATSRSAGRQQVFAARDQVETPQRTWELGEPTGPEDLNRRVITSLADHARATSSNDNDRSVHDDLGRDPASRVRAEVEAATAQRWAKADAKAKGRRKAKVVDAADQSPAHDDQHPVITNTGPGIER